MVKALKNTPPFRQGRTAYPTPRGRRGGSQTPHAKATVKCYACGQFGQIARLYVKKP